MFGIKGKKNYDAVISQYDTEYENYEKAHEDMTQKYNIAKDKFDGCISTINNQRFDFRSEINKVHTFLENYGSLTTKRLTVFDYPQESNWSRSLPKFISRIEKPYIEDASFLTDGIFSFTNKLRKNHQAITAFEERCDSQIRQQEKDLIDCQNILDSLGDGVEFAEIYLQIIGIVRETIQDRIIPGMDLVHAFFFADAIAKQIERTGTVISPVEVEAPGKYIDTPYKCHIQFILNALDFYDLCYQFFTSTTLTDLLKKPNLSEQEKEEFRQHVNHFKEEANKFANTAEVTE